MSKRSKFKHRYDDKNQQHIFPNWYSVLYGAACGFLIPWTIVLGYALPPRYISRHWDIAWVGFDCFEIILFALTAFLAIRRSSWMALTSAMLGTALVIDGWFDIFTARTQRDLRIALFEALVLELPLAILSFALSHRIFNYVRHHVID